MNQNPNQNYNDDQNKDLVVVQPNKSASNSFMDYIRNNKLIVLIVILILIALIWYFCFKKPKKTINSVTTNVPAGTNVIPTANASRLQVTKTRVSNANANSLYQ